MKRILSLILLSTFIFFYGCGKNKSDKKQNTFSIKEKTKTSKSNLALITKGQQLFKDKTCITCHQPNTKLIGPSIKDINKIYTQKNANLLSFLKGKSSAIVDVTPGQVAIMKTSLGLIKDLKDEELNAIKAYIQSVK